MPQLPTYLQFYKGSWRVRRRIPGHLIGLVNRAAFPEGGDTHITHSLRSRDEPKLVWRDRKDAAERARLPLADMQTILDRAQNRYDTLYGPLEQTRIEEPVHRYRLRDPNDPTAGVEIAGTVMVERFVKKTDLAKPALPTVKPAPAEPGAPAVDPNAVAYEAMLANWNGKIRKGKKKGPKAIQDMATKVAVFTAWLRAQALPGADDAARVTFQNCRKWRDAMQAAGEGQGTVSNHLTMVQALYSAAIEEQLASPNEAVTIETNPFKELKWDRGKDKQRPDFTPTERARILRLALDADPVIKWAMWLAAFGGYQNEELADLHARDIEESIIPGVWLLHVREDNRGPDQELKTEQRVRVMVLHQAIIDAGFLDYWRSVGDNPLFTDLPLDSYGRRSGAFTDLVNGWLHRVVKTPKTFYSHRHTTVSILRNTLQADGVSPAVNPDIARYLLGHSQSGSHAGYGENWIKTLKAAIHVIPDPLAGLSETLKPRSLAIDATPRQPESLLS
jgi:hypothetical protein